MGTSCFPVSDFIKLLLTSRSSYRLSLWHLTLRTHPSPLSSLQLLCHHVPKLYSLLSKRSFPSSLSDFSALIFPLLSSSSPCIILFASVSTIPLISPQTQGAANETKQFLQVRASDKLVWAFITQTVHDKHPSSTGEAKMAEQGPTCSKSPPRSSRLRH